MSEAPETSRHAGRFRHLFSIAIDIPLVLGTAFVLMWPLGVFEHHEAFYREQWIMRLFALLLGSYLLLNGWLLYRRGQTIGKWLTGLKVERASDGQPVPFWQLMLRVAVPIAIMVLSLTQVTLPLFAMGQLLLIVLIDTLFIFTPQRRCLHDYLAGLVVRRKAA